MDTWEKWNQLGEQTVNIVYNKQNNYEQTFEVDQNEHTSFHNMAVRQLNRLVNVRHSESNGRNVVKLEYLIG